MGPTDRFCPIKLVPFRGVNCSDAAGHEIEYHLIQDTLDNNESLTGRMWDSSVSTPWYNYKASGAPCPVFVPSLLVVVNSYKVAIFAIVARDALLQCADVQLLTLELV